MKKVWPPIFVKQSFESHFRITGLEITYSGQQEGSQILGHAPISQKNDFNILIAQAHESMQIGFGVIDSKHINDEWTSPNEKNIIYYWANGGIVRGDGKGLIKRKGITHLKEGDYMTVAVSLEKGEIEWKINFETV